MSQHSVPDQAERKAALDPEQSFIVQAPAGSGKTELLTQRFLVLLSRVENPEAIIALTFTRKAAQEMRHRILSAMRNAEHSEAPEEAHAKITWEIAKRALQQNEKMQWHLLEHPNRLRIQTIDSLQAALTRQMPLLSGMAGPMNISEFPQALYQQAAENIVSSIAEETPWQQDLKDLLLHLDNRLEGLSQLFQEMLAKRDLWLPAVLQAKSIEDLREHIESGLESIILQTLENLVDELDPEDAHECVELAAFAASMLDGAKSRSAISACFQLSKAPRASLDDLPIWNAYCELFLIASSDQFRKQVNKAQGFPAPSDFKNPEERDYFKLQKSRMTKLLAKFQQNPRLEKYFSAVRHAPCPRYDEQQWTILQALLRLLPIAAAELKLVFDQEKTVDFTEISRSAARALGELQEPSDLALRLDYQIQHLLVDEFQDTSLSQFQLLTRLTTGWQMGDGRTLFCVGDPMQSIYRFRQAEVGLFLHAEQHGIGNIVLNSLKLHANFRSQAGIIQWINHHFSAAFPSDPDISLGAIPYSPSHAIREALDTAVSLSAVETELEEAAQICEQIQKIPEDSASIAILVRSRSHLLFITQALKAANIAYEAVELEHLADKMMIQDLWSLTRALLHPYDRLAWLSVLRSPLCGLDLADLYTIASQSEHTSIWQVIQDFEHLSVTAAGKIRLSRVVPALAASLEYRLRISLRDLVEKTWLALGGPATVLNKHELPDAEVFFQCLSACEKNGDLFNYEDFESRLLKSFSNPIPSVKARCHIMTIHKAKGLEFDFVILPGLARRPNHSMPPLLRWAEFPNPAGQPQLILAPIKATSDDHDPLSHYLARLEKQKEFLEITRLFYVAATRAKKGLFAYACLAFDAEKNAWKAPPENSFLGHLWETVAGEISTTTTIPSPPTEMQRQLHRLTLEWQAPTWAQMPEFLGQNNPRELDLSFEKDPHAALGTLCHRLLRQAVMSDMTDWGKNKFDAYLPNWSNALIRLGVPSEHLEMCLEKLTRALRTMLADPTGRWILSPTHEDSQCEYALTQIQEGVAKTVILDRTFVADDIRWIIDYKIAEPKGESLEVFLHQQKQQYSLQLSTYAEWMKALDSRPIKCALYFPLNTGFISWDGGVESKT